MGSKQIAPTQFVLEGDNAEDNKNRDESEHSRNSSSGKESEDYDYMKIYVAEQIKRKFEPLEENL